MNYTWHACKLFIKGILHTEYHAFVRGATMCAKSLTSDAPAEADPPAELRCKRCIEQIKHMEAAA